MSDVFKLLHARRLRRSAAEGAAGYTSPLGCGERRKVGGTILVSSR